MRATYLETVGNELLNCVCDHEIAACEKKPIRRCLVFLVSEQKFALDMMKSESVFIAS